MQQESLRVVVSIHGLLPALNLTTFSPSGQAPAAACCRCTLPVAARFSLRCPALLVQIYEHLKEKSGSLKPGIESVEGTVKNVVGPVISRIDFVPDEYLKFVDAKVSETALLDVQVACHVLAVHASRVG